MSHVYFYLRGGAAPINHIHSIDDSILRFDPFSMDGLQASETIEALDALSRRIAGDIEVHRRSGGKWWWKWDPGAWAKDRENHAAFYATYGLLSKAHWYQGSTWVIRWADPARYAPSPSSGR